MATTNEKIRKQFEFYFSDSNLPHDRYLWNKHKENDGWIPIADVAGFKKIKMLTEDQDAVVAALKEGPLEHIEINETNDKLRRKTPVQQVDHDARSIYAKNIPELSEESADKVADLLNLQDEVQEFFEQYGKVLAVRMRRVLFGVRKGKFKGSVFVEFSTPEEAEKVAAMSLKFKDNDLLLMPKKAYYEKKEKEFAAKDRVYTREDQKAFNAFTNNTPLRANNNKRKAAPETKKADDEQNKKAKADDETKADENKADQ